MNETQRANAIESAAIFVQREIQSEVDKAITKIEEAGVEDINSVDEAIAVMRRHFADVFQAVVDDLREKAGG